MSIKETLVCTCLTRIIDLVTNLCRSLFSYRALLECLSVDLKTENDIIIMF